MTATKTTPAPIAGPLYRQAVKVQIEGSKRRKLFCLLAAYIDAVERVAGEVG